VALLVCSGLGVAGWLVFESNRIRQVSGLVDDVSDLATKDWADIAPYAEIITIFQRHENIPVLERSLLDQAGECIVSGATEKEARGHVSAAAEAGRKRLTMLYARTFRIASGGVALFLVLSVVLLVRRGSVPQSQPPPKTKTLSPAEKLMKGMERHSPTFLCNQEGRIEWANSAMADLLGGYVTAEQLVGMTLTTISQTLEFDAGELDIGFEQSCSLDTVVKIMVGDEPEVSVWHLSPASFDGGDGLFFTVTINVGYNFVASREAAMMTKALASYSEGIAFVSDGKVIWANDGVASFIGAGLKGEDLKGRTVDWLARSIGIDLNRALASLDRNKSASYSFRKGYQSLTRVDCSPVGDGDSYVMLFRREDELTREVMDLLELIRQKLTTITTATERLVGAMPTRFLREMQQARGHIQAELRHLQNESESETAVKNLAERLRECLKALDDLGDGPNIQEIEEAFDLLTSVTGAAVEQFRSLEGIAGSGLLEEKHQG
jgi:PAS domain-containing protein